MAETVYVLGAGFNCSALKPNQNKQPPLARNFFQVFLRSGYAKFMDYYQTLFDEIEHYWKLDRSALTDCPFDIEECFTFLESQLRGNLPPERESAMRDARSQLLNLLMMYLGRFEFTDTTDAATEFGHRVISEHADVLTFNYDTLAEQVIESVSGLTGAWAGQNVREEDFDISQFYWNRNLAYGVKFSEVALPIPGVPQDVGGDKYYRHPSNTFYPNTRVLKLHGSLNWLRRTPEVGDGWIEISHEVVLDRSSSVWPGAGPARAGGPWEPVIIPPQLGKLYGQAPISEVWSTASHALSECQRLVLIGYSFPPTDFYARRLFREVFSTHRLRELTMVNPDGSITDIVRNLTHYDGPVTACKSLQALYSGS
jgi:hypothetical protein